MEDGVLRPEDVRNDDIPNIMQYGGHPVIGLDTQQAAEQAQQRRRKIGMAQAWDALGAKNSVRRAVRLHELQRLRHQLRHQIRAVVSGVACPRHIRAGCVQPLSRASSSGASPASAPPRLAAASSCS